jgi:hypothetical protein
MIAATFHGPNYDSSNNDESTIEVFDSIGHAMSALFDRYDSGGVWKVDVNYLDGSKESTYFPMVTEGHYLKCYLIPDDFADEVMPGMDEGVIESALTAVHGGTADYTLTLVPPFGKRSAYSSDTIAVSVTRA